MRIWVFLFLFSVSSWAEDSFRFQVFPVEGLSKQQQEVVQKFYDHIATILPPLMKHRIAHVVNVYFEKMDNDTYGESYGYKIWVNRDLLLPAILKGPKNSEKSTRKIILRTIYEDAVGNAIHEVTHVYDWINFRSLEDKKIFQKCESWQSNTLEFQSLPRLQFEQCQAYLRSKYSVSDRPSFLALAGWNYLGKNGHTYRSPDAYEFKKNSSEFFAVNMSLFLLESDFACRRPTVYRFLSEHFQFQAFPNQNCDQNLHFIIPVGVQALLFDLDPSRVYQIHYLQAGAGDEAMSKWGHSMLRVILCAPDRKQVNADCLKDLSYHFVISFRAFIDSFQMNSWKGISGEYPSRVFLIPFRSLITEYNLTELRDIISYPLKLSRDQIRQVLVRANEYHWSYSGKYYFLGNNSADETLDLIRSSVFRPYLESMVIHTPEDLRAQWQSLNFLDMSVFQDKKSDKEKGYFFESYLVTYKKAYQFLASGSPLLKSMDLDDFLRLTSDQRFEIYRQIQKEGSHTQRKLAASFYLLESHAMRLLKKKIVTSLQDLFLQEEFSSDQEELKKAKDAKMKEAQEPIKRMGILTAPYQLLSETPRYGIPTREEIQKAILDIQKMKNPDLKEEEKKWEDFAKIVDADFIKELEKQKDHVSVYTKDSSN